MVDLPARLGWVSDPTCSVVCMLKVGSETQPTCLDLVAKNPLSCWLAIQKAETLASSCAPVERSSAEGPLSKNFADIGSGLAGTD